MISDEAVEAAARQMSLKDGDIIDWPLYRDDARAALEAAAPHMYAQALEDAVAAFPLETIVAPDNAVVWMMRRAEELRKK